MQPLINNSNIFHCFLPVLSTVFFSTTVNHPNNNNVLRQNNQQRVYNTITHIIIIIFNARGVTDPTGS